MSQILCILDGFGFRQDDQNNAISRAKTPNFKKILKKYPWTLLDADGQNVGQENGLVGNSEVGHMNIGGLKLVPQLSYQITKSAERTFDLDTKISPDQLFDPKHFLSQKMSSAKSKNVHLIGLFSTGTIHSDLRHWASSIQAAHLSGADKIILHLISDGRDSDRQSFSATWDNFLKTYQNKFETFIHKIYLGSIGGRFFAMDRDHNWDRVFLGLYAMFAADEDENNILDIDLKLDKLLATKDIDWHELSKAPRHSYFATEADTTNLEQISEMLGFYTKLSYDENVFDEHVLPDQLFYGEAGKANHGISKNDTIWFINFRTDRMKQFSQLLVDLNQEFDLQLDILAMNDYGDGNAQSWNGGSKKNVGYYPIFKSKPVADTLAERISKADKTQLHIAETEKYNHVTYFLNGGQNKKWPQEDWVVIPSNKVASHAEKPEMKCLEITEHLLEVLAKNSYDYIVVNYANPDMLGHTGDLEAAIKSMEFLDLQLGRLLDLVETGGHNLIITADHGNVEVVGQTVDGKMDTEHNPNPVPLILVTPNIDLNELEKGLEITNSNLIEPLNIKNLISELNRPKLLKDEQEWFTKEQIKDFLPTQDLPLWYAGVLLLSLG